MTFTCLSYASVLILTLFITTSWINARQPAPYMDELYHVPQAQKFCSAAVTFALSDYDAAISTPPGLYLPVAILAFLTRSSSVCSTRVLRITSAVITMLSFFVLSSVLCRLRVRMKQTVNEKNANTVFVQPERIDYALALVMILTPVSFFFSAFYYTDPPAMLYILLTWFFSLNGNHLLSALMGVMATFTRQTNMFWHFFLVSDNLLYLLFVSRKERPTLQAAYSAILNHNLPHLGAGVLYLLFLYINNGAAIGDKQHHVAMVHHAMLPYFSFYHAVAHSFLQFATPNTLLRAVKALFTLPSVWSVVVGTAGTMMGLIVSTADYAHPFSLADNRHFTFYLYRRWLLRSALHRLVLVPLYIWTPTTAFIEQITTHFPSGHRAYHRFTDFLLFLVICTLMLHPLLELRYFTIPSLILSIRRVARLKTPSSLTLLHAGAVLLIGVNMILVYIFAELPFERRPDGHALHDLSPGRFMF